MTEISSNTDKKKLTYHERRKAKKADAIALEVGQVKLISTITTKEQEEAYKWLMIRKIFEKNIPIVAKWIAGTITFLQALLTFITQFL